MFFVPFGSTLSDMSPLVPGKGQHLVQLSLWFRVSPLQLSKLKRTQVANQTRLSRHNVANV